MGGGIVSKEKFFRNGNPTRLVKSTDPNYWLLGGNFIMCAEHVDYLKTIDVGLIVTLTIEPIKEGLNINHIPCSFDETEWTFVDSDTIKKLKNFQILHIPIADQYFPTEENKTRLLSEIQKFHNENPSKKVWVHCWAGKGRTSTAIYLHMMNSENMSFKDVREYFNGLYVSDAQYNYLNGLCLSEADYINSQPIIKTPTDHKCYQSNQ
jgi:hypothetical protein